MNFTVDKEKYKNGDSIEYQCKTKAGSNGTATCENGKWTKTMDCEGKEKLDEICIDFRTV